MAQERVEAEEGETLDLHRAHCDHGTYWWSHCWACDQDGRVRCTDCEEKS